MSTWSLRFAVPRQPTDFAAVLATLRRHRVRFVLVGGVAAVVEGAPIATFDLDVVPDRDARNIDRLEEALSALRAHYRERPDLGPTAEALRGPGHHLLMTRHGPLDVLGVVGKDRDFRALLPHARRRVLGDARVWVLDLETQIAIKQELNSAKDRAVIPILQATLDQRRRRRP
ncbi:MAG TPA: hypothetical protein VMW17_21080 [Candidatus Binatia bacterium]|nr:hypothetical protein [Candidatus Binatia bacterium]